METLTLAQVRDALIVLLAVMAFVVLLGNTIKTIKGWTKPVNDLEEWRKDVNTKLDKDNGRLNDLEEGNKVICRGILALLSHEINGNSKEKLINSQKEITDYLINR
jgi:hypothetical protein